MPNQIDNSREEVIRCTTLNYGDDSCDGMITWWQIGKLVNSPMSAKNHNKSKNPSGNLHNPVALA